MLTISVFVLIFVLLKNNTLYLLNIKGLHMNKFDIEMTDERKKEIRKLKQQILKDRFLAISFSPLLFSLILV